MHRFEAAAVLALLLLGPVALCAQTPGSSGQRHAALQRLADSQVVRLSAPGIGRRQGALLRPDTGDILFVSDRAPLRIPAVSIDTLRTRGGSSGTGSAKNVLGMAGMGAIGGSLLGAIIGAPIQRWKRRFP